MIQTSSFTLTNRYPILFDIASKELKGIPEPKILSFGCSSGEEVFSLKQYMPNAKITGVEINRRNLAIAKKKDKQRAFEFYHFSDKKWQIEAYYDAIFALAVFQRSEHRNPERTISLKSFQFKHFADMISLLDSLLKPNGVFVIDNSDYRFRDLKQSLYYRVSELDIISLQQRPYYSENGLKTLEKNIDNRVFVKQRHS